MAPLPPARSPCRVPSAGCCIGAQMPDMNLSSAKAARGGDQRWEVARPRRPPDRRVGRAWPTSLASTPAPHACARMSRALRTLALKAAGVDDRPTRTHLPQPQPLPPPLLDLLHEAGSPPRPSRESGCCCWSPLSLPPLLRARVAVLRSRARTHTHTSLALFARALKHRAPTVTRRGGGPGAGRACGRRLLVELAARAWVARSGVGGAGDCMIGQICTRVRRSIWCPACLFRPWPGARRCMPSARRRSWTTRGYAERNAAPMVMRVRSGSERLRPAQPGVVVAVVAREPRLLLVGTRRSAAHAAARAQRPTDRASRRLRTTTAACHAAHHDRHNQEGGDEPPRRAGPAAAAGRVRVDAVADDA